MLRGQRVFGALEALTLPVVAAVNGYALGGGLELAMACDFRVAARSARFGQPEITLANIPGWGGTQRLPRLVGEGRAMDLILTGRLIDAEEAAAIGLVHQLCENGETVDAALALLNRVTAHSRVAIAEAKQAIHASRLAGPAGYAVERHGVAVCCATAEQADAVARFLATQRERRPPGSKHPPSPERPREPACGPCGVTADSRPGQHGEGRPGNHQSPADHDGGTQ